MMTEENKVKEMIKRILGRVRKR